MTSANVNPSNSLSITLAAQWVQTVYNFSYTGSRQSFTTPITGYYKLETWGAEGGYKSSDGEFRGGDGGYATGIINLTKSDTVYVYVGGNGNRNPTSGGYNGGGKSSSAHSVYGGGGGATDMRLKTDSLYSRVIVAGGGGSQGYDTNTNGGYGGGDMGTTASQDHNVHDWVDYSEYGSQVFSGESGNFMVSSQSASTTSLTDAKGGFGFGGNSGGSYSSSVYGGAGGGGWYGGLGSDRVGGGGGSGWVYTAATSAYWKANSNEGKTKNLDLTSQYYLTSAETLNGIEQFPSTSGGIETGHNGDGYARITYIGQTLPERWDYGYTGDYQTFTTPKTGRYKIELWGAAGGVGTWASVSHTSGGRGAYTSGEITLNTNDVLYVYVGQAGETAHQQEKPLGKEAKGGWNGGGKSGNTTTSGGNSAAGGGGATDIRTTSGVWDNTTSLRSRIMVAAGGGGGAYGGPTYAFATEFDVRGSCIICGGNGLYSSGTATMNSGAVTVTHTTQTSGYSIGRGQDGALVDRLGPGGSGGGYYGAYSVSTPTGVTGLGGTSYISGHTGCIAVASASSSSPKCSGSSSTTNSCSVHYSGKVFTNTIMIDGSGYRWTTAKSESSTGMPSPQGQTIIGKGGNGYARITYLGN